MKNLCEKCGTELIDGVCPKCVQSEAKMASRYEGKFKNFFMSPKEKLVAILGNSYLDKFLHDGSIEKGFSVVSDKRVYFQGNNYYISHDAKGKKKVIRNQQSRTVDLKDVTGTGTDSYVNIALIIWGCIFATLWMLLEGFYLMHGALVLQIAFSIILGARFAGITYILTFFNLLFFMLGVYFFYKYKQSKISLITIQYAGGVIGFDNNWFTQQEIDLFQKQLRLAKDKAIEAGDNAVVNKLQEAVSNMTQSVSYPNSKVDELSKLVDLLQKGAITQEEYEKMKKELI